MEEWQKQLVGKWILVTHDGQYDAWMKLKGVSWANRKVAAGLSAVKDVEIAEGVVTHTYTLLKMIKVKQTLDPAATEPVEGSENGDRVLLLARWDATTCSLVFHKTFPDRQLVETMTNAVSEDGATMTVTLTTTSKGGQSVTTVDTFSRARDSKRWSSG
mmetsp:Transcript_39476/g.130673  ORF Transcript_39476/g.130673 Transcript_39476/m.130673 type:complete len:159 (+) Transcript_39476:79-555(+)